MSDSFRLHHNILELNLTWSRMMVARCCPFQIPYRLQSVLTTTLSSRVFGRRSIVAALRVPACALPRALPVSVTLVRWSATYASDPVRWQSDTDVETYWSLVEKRVAEPEAFLTAAERLRKRADLPADLRASAGRLQADELLRQAFADASDLRIDPEAPWPELSHGKVLAAAERAHALYCKVVAESTADDLVAADAPYSSAWSGEVFRNATRAAHIEARKLVMEVHLLEVRWLTPQVERARAIAHAARSGDVQSVKQLSQRLCSAGLPEAPEEEDLLRRAVARAEAAVAICDDAIGMTQDDNPADDVMGALLAKGQAYLAGLHTDLALACAIAQKPGEAAECVTRALGLAATAGNAVTSERAEELRETAQAIWDDCTKSIQGESASGAAEKALRRSIDLGAALVQFDARRRS
ncbi:unnamed protein product [Polarella glacialis]|uniref:Uncharacterized protein n=1 Tax=Polarella glacialis TaxID=89957 RepID=A0A813GHB0_POLGL|nr:unnamed protein product [Polarella glacialis]